MCTYPRYGNGNKSIKFLDSRHQWNILALFVGENSTYICSDKLTLSFWLSFLAEINSSPCQIMSWPTRSLLKKKIKYKLCKVLRYILTPKWKWFAFLFFLFSQNLLLSYTPCNANVIAIGGGGRKEKENGQEACERCILQLIKGREWHLIFCIKKPRKQINQPFI